jgi:thioesterase domain-containing protein
VGELCIGGDGIAAGYWKQQELTAQRFVPDRFSPEPGARLYRSGDLARFRTDGNIELLGRLDHQVKIRGFRIEPGEIEEVIKSHPSVKEAVVLPCEDSPGNKRLVAYIVPTDGSQPTVDGLRQWATTKLPPYMAPSGYVFLNAFPLTANGKLDRDGLREMRAHEPENRTAVAPRDELESQIAAIWQRALNVSAIGVHDNFFQAGGHSLLAVQVLADMERSLGKTLSLADFFHAPTVEAAARLLRNQVSRATNGRLVPLQSEGSRQPLFLLQGTPEIARKMGLDQPFYTCLPHGEDGFPVPPTMEEIAAEYLREIRAIQPYGPYVIGGFSFTGLVAYEIAQQLKRQGEQISLLVLVDPTPSALAIGKVSNTAPSQPLLTSAKARFQEVGFQPLQMISAGWTAVKWRVEGRVVRITRRITTPIKWAICRGLLPVWTRLPFKPYALRKFYFFQASMRVARNYKPLPYDGRVVLFQAEVSAGREEIWKSLVRGVVHVHKLPGNHTVIVREPNASTVAEILKGYLQEQTSPIPS